MTETSAMPWGNLQREPASALPDLGPAVLGSLFEKLMIDEEWAVREGRSFTWWPYRLAQRVWVSPPQLVLGDALVAVRVVNDFVSDIKSSDDVVEDVMSVLNMHAALSTYVWDPDQRRATITTSAYIHEGNRSLERFLSVAALLSTIEAHAKAQQVAGILAGLPTATGHPTSGERSQPDDLLSFAEAEIAPRGQAQSAFVGPSMELAGQASGIDWSMASASPTGFAGELPFLSDMPAMVQGALGKSGPRVTSLVQLLTEPSHPAYGSGLLALLRLPIPQPAAEVQRVAHGLNRAEAQELTGFPQFGAWCQDPSNGTALVFATFVPSALFDPGIASLLLFYNAMRNDWAKNRLLTSSGGT